MEHRIQFEDLKSQLKRAEHLLYVSLKYTRTVDVIRSIIERMINAFDSGMMALLLSAKKKKKKLEVPTTPVQQCAMVEELFSADEKIKEFCELYSLLREIMKHKYTKKEEYRRHVAMIVEIEPGKTIEINIDKLYEYYEKLKEFAAYVEEKI